MYDAAKNRFRSMIENELSRSGTKDRATLDAIFAKLDLSVERLIADRGLDEAQGETLKRALADAKAEHAPAQSPQADIGTVRKAPPELIAAPKPIEAPVERRSSRSMRRWVGGGLAAAGLVAAVIVMPDIAAALQPSPAKPDRHLVVFQARLDTSAKSVDAITGYLSQVRKVVEERQKADPIGVAALAGSGWISLKAFDTEIFAKRPKALPRKVEIKLHADGDAYKVLLRTPLCTDAKYLKPDFVDPKRDPKSVGCDYLAVWNKAGEKL